MTDAHRIESDRSTPLQPRLAAAIDPVESALVDALKVATAASDLDAIRAVAEELRARRLERQGVIDLTKKRPRSR